MEPLGKISLMTRLFSVLTLLAVLIGFLGLAYGLETAIILLTDGNYIVPAVYVILLAEVIFDAVYLFKGHPKPSGEPGYKLLTRFFIISSWVTIVVFTLLILFMIYFGLFVEKNAEVYLVLLLYIVGFVGPAFLSSLAFLGLHKYRKQDNRITLMQPYGQYIILNQETMAKIMI